MSKKVCIHYVCHGKTLFNSIGKMQGCSDSPLEKKGIVDAGIPPTGVDRMK